MASFPVYNIEGQKKDSIELPDAIFGQRINQNILHQAVLMYQAGQRQGTLKTKNRVDVSGGGKKPFRQKGTGRARAGSNRSPLWMGGGVIFGPVPRDFSYSIPRQIKVSALRESLNSKFMDKDLMCVADLNIKSAKTKDFVKALNNLKLVGSKVLALWDGKDENLMRVSRNVPHFNLVRAQDVNAYDILRNKKLLVTKSALQDLLKRVIPASDESKGRKSPAAAAEKSAATKSRPKRAGREGTT